MSRRTRVKICCIASQDEAQLATAMGADALGLVGPMPTGPGVVGDEQARQIAAACPAGISTFLLTSETSARGIIAHARRCQPACLQIVDYIDPRHYVEIAAELPAVRLVQVVHVESEAALDRIDDYASFVHSFLLDSGRPSERELGGTGRVHDWAISQRFVGASAKPVFLAGGLNPDNVGNAIEAVRPFGVDVCSGIRTDGRLDPGKLTAFMAAVEAARMRN